MNIRYGGVAALLLAACGPGPEVPACDSVAPIVSLTQGQDTATDLVDGDPITMVHGPQGGWHIEVGLRVVAPDPRISMDLSVQALGAEVVFNHYDMRLLQYEECAGTREGLFGFLNVTALVDGELNTPPELLVGADLVVVAEVEGEFGVGRAEVRLVGEPDPKDVPD